MKRASLPFVVVIFASFFLLTFSSLSLAEPIYATKEPVEIDHPFYVGAFGAWVIPEEFKIENGITEKIKLNQSWAAGAKAGYILPLKFLPPKWAAAELEYFYIDDQNVNDPGTDYYKSNNVMANLILRYPDGMIRPYIGGGLGWSWGEFGDASVNNSSNALAWQGLAGINLEIIPNLSVDFGYRYFMSKYDASTADAALSDHLLLLGLNFHFGGSKPVPPPSPFVPEPLPVVKEQKCPDTPACCIVDEDGCPFDSDQDGVCDGCDKCPGTPDCCMVDQYGCPIDSDKDGVCDGCDKCPDTPDCCMVDQNGCSIDSDQDGVCDGCDKCPDTPEIAKVDKDGCPYMAVIRLTVQFDYKKDIVKPEFYANIKELGDFMKKHPNLNATIEGHTCNIASEKYNLNLSKRRAESVMKVLIDRENIDPKRLKAVGYGFSRPVASNDTPEGQALNRRVQALLEAQATKK